MLRRDFVRVVVSASLAPKYLLSQQTANPAPPPPAPVPWTLGLSPKTPVPHTDVVEGITEPEEHFFTPLQMATLLRLCDVLVPSIDDRPGALQAGTPLFLDFLIGASPAARKNVYTGGLKWLDGESQTRYRQPFAKVDDMQAGAILKPWLRTWMTDHPPTEPHADFINIAHDDIRTATVNSKAWSDAPPEDPKGPSALGLYWSPIEPDLHALGSEPSRVPAHVRAAPKAAHTMPAYPR